MRLKIEVPVQVQLEAAVWAHVGPEQRADRPPVFGAQRNRLVGEDALQQKGVDEDERGLQQVQREHANFLAVAVGAGEFAVLGRRIP